MTIYEAKKYRVWRVVDSGPIHLATQMVKVIFSNKAGFLSTLLHQGPMPHLLAGSSNKPLEII